MGSKENVDIKALVQSPVHTTKLYLCSFHLYSFIYAFRDWERERSISAVWAVLHNECVVQICVRQAVSSMGLGTPWPLIGGAFQSPRDVFSV